MHRLIAYPFLYALLCAGLPGLGCGMQTEPPEASADGPVAFVDVNVVPMNRDTLLAHHTVLIQDGKIAAMGPSEAIAVPEEAFRIDGSGKYLMPGLIDMATYGLEAEELLMHVANGVTATLHVRGANLHQAWNEQITRGDMIGPTLYVTGNFVDGPETLRNGNYHSVETRKEARRAVERHEAHHYNFLRVGFTLSAAHYDALIDEAEQRGIRVVGDVPVAAGLAGVKHPIVLGLEVVVQALLNKDAPSFDVTRGSVRPQGEMPAAAYAYVDESSIGAVAEHLRAKRISIIPALIAFQKNHMPLAERQTFRASDARVKYVSPFTRAFWERSDRNEVSEEDAALAQAAHTLRLRLTKALHDADVPLALGTTALSPHVLLGYAAHEELALLAEAGIPPFEVLHIATFHGAAALGMQEEFGTVEAGKRADLILLENNPLDDVRHVQDRAGVMLRGRWYTQPQLDGMLADVAAFYEEEDRFMGTLENEGLDAARQRYQEAIAADPDAKLIRHTRLVYRVYALRAQQQYDDALALLDFALEMFPDEWYLYETQGEVYCVMGDTTRAIASFEQSLVRWPRNEDARYAIAELQGDVLE